MDRFINIFINVVMRRVINYGINKGVGAFQNARQKPKPRKGFEDGPIQSREPRG